MFKNLSIFISTFISAFVVFLAFPFMAFASGSFTASNASFDPTVSPATFAFDYSGYTGGTITKVYLSGGNNHLLSGASNSPSCTATHCQGVIDQGLGAFPLCSDSFFYLMLYDGSSNHWSQSLPVS